MEFNTNRGAQPTPARAASAAGTTSSASSRPSVSKSWNSSPSWLRVMWVVLLFAITCLAISMVFLLHYGGTKEVSYVNTKTEQAVFLTNGQVYFGRVTAINSRFVDLQGVYYLNVNQQVQPNQKDATTNAANSNQSVSLVKLGCELHGPLDQMIINRDQVTFWENLKTDGQVSKAISQWVQQNPKGQQCSTATSTPTTTTKP